MQWPSAGRLSFCNPPPRMARCSRRVPGFSEMHIPVGMKDLVLIALSVGFFAVA